MKHTLNLGQDEVIFTVGRNLFSYAAKYLEEEYGNEKIFFIVDKNIPLNKTFEFEEVLKSYNLNYQKIILEGGESSKNFVAFHDLIELILSFNPSRNSVLIAFGGGATGDVVGFCASTILRGINYIQYPTTLLAQVDSAIGGKVAINSKWGKNLIGAFYNPKKIFIDISMLASLPERQLKAGYSEILKYGLLGDKSFYNYLLENTKYFQIENLDYLEYIVTKSFLTKAAIVSRDFYEKNERMLLNLGHTFAHALEAECEYEDILNHGEAVSIGLILAAKYSKSLGYIAREKVSNLEEHLRSIGLPVSLSDIKKDWNLDKIIESILRDKKHTAKEIKLILLKNIGEAYVERNVSINDLKDFLLHNLI